MPVPIALQLYSVRNECAQDLLGVIAQVARMGYAGVEFAGYHGHSAAEIRKVLDDNGLKTEGTHTPIDAFDDEKIEATIELHKTLGTEFAIIPWIPEAMRNTPDACRATAERLTALVERLAPHGLRTGFHAHAGDMRPLENGQSAWQMIAANTPDAFIMQYDTANGLMGGADPVQPIRDLPGRNASLHLKGWSGDHAALVGEGDIDWPQVFDAAENGGGVQWYVVEHEEEEGALEAVEQCLKNLRALGK
jgi:sugar phosphate isomerase/epimerase